MAKLSADEHKRITRGIRALERDLKYAPDEEKLEMEHEILELKTKLEDPYGLEEEGTFRKKKYKTVYKKGRKK